MGLIFQIYDEIAQYQETIVYIEELGKIVIMCAESVLTLCPPFQHTRRRNYV